MGNGFWGNVIWCGVKDYGDWISILWMENVGWGLEEEDDGWGEKDVKFLDDLNWGYFRCDDIRGDEVKDDRGIWSILMEKNEKKKVNEKMEMVVKKEKKKKEKRKS